jgi:hypothetical protein
MTRWTASKLFIALGAASMILFSAPVAPAQGPGSPRFSIFAGPGLLLSQGHSSGEFQVGASIDQTAPNAWIGYSVEGGYLAPWARLKSGSGFFSFDYMPSWHFGHATPDASWKFLPYVSAGYTRLFGTGNAMNFGVGADYRFRKTQAIRVDIRDYYSFASPRQHNVALRIGWVIYLWD